MKKFPLTISGIMIFALAGCSDSPQSDTSPMTTENTRLPDALYGAWKTDCSSNGEGTTYLYSEWVFTSSTISLSTFSYDPEDTACTNATDRNEITYEATYLSDMQETSLGDAIKVDMLATSYKVYAGSTIFFDSSVDGLPVDINDEYQIFLINDGKLYSGGYTSGDASTPETRPTAIDSRDGITRKQ